MAFYSVTTYEHPQPKVQCRRRQRVTVQAAGRLFNSRHGSASTGVSLYTKIRLNSPSQIEVTPPRAAGADSRCLTDMASFSIYRTLSHALL